MNDAVAIAAAQAEEQAEEEKMAVASTRFCCTNFKFSAGAFSFYESPHRCV
jgi:hypothetical protein